MVSFTILFSTFIHVFENQFTRYYIQLPRQMTTLHYVYVSGWLGVLLYALLVGVLQNFCSVWSAPPEVSKENGKPECHKWRESKLWKLYG